MCFPSKLGIVDKYLDLFPKIQRLILKDKLRHKQKRLNSKWLCLSKLGIVNRCLGLFPEKLRVSLMGMKSHKQKRLNSQ